MLGLFTWRQNPNRLSATYLVTNVSVAIWALCYMLLHEFQALVPVNLVSQIQLVSALVFANGHFDISVRYPDPSRLPGPIVRWLNIAVFLTLSGLVLFSDVVSRAVLQEGNVVFVDGPGYTVYALYLMVLGLALITNLIISYRRYPAYRIRLGYMLTGLGLFIAFGVIFDLVLVVLGNYDWLVLGHLGSIFPSLFFAYAFSKYDLLDMQMLVDRYTAKIIVSALAVLSLYLAFQLSFTAPSISLLLICAIALFWAFNAARLELFLVSTARRRFVKNWYEPEDILNRLAEKLEIIKNRAEILQTLSEEIDDVFELESIQRIVALRDKEDHLVSYQLIFNDVDRPRESLSVDDFVIQECIEMNRLSPLSDYSKVMQARVLGWGHSNSDAVLIVPFFSPEHLEGVLILGERSSQEEFSVKDRQFLTRLMRYVAAILYRLTPFERLEKQYFENQRRLHQAEIQLVRAEKTRAIAHATRQAHHEIRTPLNIIRMAVNRIKSLDSIEKYRKITEEQIERAMEIVDETLIITDGVEDEEERYQAVDVNQILQRSLRLQEEGPHTHSLDLDAGAPRINAIPGEIQVLFSNLIKNALEAMPEGGTLSIRSFVELGELVVVIADTGQGIDPQLREKIWEPYFSGKTTGAGNSTAGRGWGLTICNRIVTELKGSIQCDSAIGKGTRFTVRLPITP